MARSAFIGSDPFNFFDIESAIIIVNKFLYINTIFTSFFLKQKNDSTNSYHECVESISPHNPNNRPVKHTRI